MACCLCRILHLAAPDPEYGAAVLRHPGQSRDLRLTALAGEHLFLPGNLLLLKALRCRIPVNVMDKPVHNQQYFALPNAPVMLRQLLYLSRSLYVGGRGVDHTSHMAASILIICSYIHHCKRLIIFSQYKLSPIFPIAFPSYSCYTLL